MSLPSVSVIMPVYNTEAFVKEAIESVFRQTLVDWELILVNDGSTDNSLKILQYYAQIDSRISLISQANQGLSAARNAGVSVAKGQYLYFLDSDDEIVPETFQLCFDYCEDLSLDFLFFDANTKFDKDVDTRNINLQYIRNKTKPHEVNTGVNMLSALLSSDEFLSSACLIFTSTRFIRDNSLSFLKGIVHEDELYTTTLFLHALRVMYLPHQLFVRRLRGDSIMTSAVRKFNIDSYFIVANRLKKIGEDTPEYAEVIDQYLTKLLNAVIWKAHVLSFQERIAILRESIIHWFPYIQTRNWMILMFKKYLPKK